MTIQKVGKGTVHQSSKITYHKSKIHQNRTKRYRHIYQYHKKNKGAKKSVKFKNTSIKVVGVAGANTVANQMEGTDEVRDAWLITYGVTRPMIATASNGAGPLRQKVLAEKIRRIKKVGSGKKLARRQIKEKSQKVAKKTAKDTARKVAKETAKKTVRVTTKIATNVAVTTAGTAVVGPLSPLIGVAAGEVAGAKKDHKYMKQNSRVRKIKFFLDKTNTQDKQQDSVIKLLRDLAMNRVAVPLRKMTFALGGFFFVLILLIFVIAVPVATVVTTIYNSPFALFLPPLEEGDTVMSIASEYIANFNQEVSILANNHSGYDGGEIVYVDYEGIDVNPRNYYDIMCVYMVKHGIGDVATLMNNKSKGWLKDIVNDMCFYTTSSRTETYKNNDGTRYLETILSVNVTLKNYKDMISVYNFDIDQTGLINKMMSPEYLAIIGYGSGGIDDGNITTSLTQAEVNAIMSSITDSMQRATVSFALSKVGFPYSQDYRDTGKYYDCSSLAYYSWKAAGINISFGGATTASAEAQGLEQAGKTILESELQPGDLIFYSYTNNGRYKNISHVGIYVGEGKMVEAKNEAVGVVYGNFHNKSAVMYARPNKQEKKG